MEIKFKTLTLHNFKSHRDLTVEFGDLTKITGENTKGKSSILEAIPWLLYSVDVLGSKSDPTPINYEYDHTLVKLHFAMDGKDVLLSRGIEKGKATYYINDVPSKAKEYEELVKSLFDKDLFLSLYNPSYYFTLKWNEQRELLLRYVSAPANKEVFAQLPKQQAEKLGELVKKHSLADLEKIHRDNKNKKDKAYIAAQSKTKTLQEQSYEEFNRLDHSIDIQAAKEEMAKLTEQIEQIERVTKSADENNRIYNEIESNIDSLIKRRDKMQKQAEKLKDEKIEDICRVCKQPLNNEARQAAEAEKQQRVDQFKEEYAAVVEKRQKLEQDLKKYAYIGLSVQLDQLREFERERMKLWEHIQGSQKYAQLEQQLAKAKEDEADTLASLNESIFIIDAIKDFAAKEAEMMADKVQALFTTLSLRLFKTNKTDGEIKPDFEIEMDGKPYRKLSLSESIRAGLELRDVLSQQSGIIAPCMVDNAESITRFKQPNGQLIVSRVVPGQELTIEMEDMK
ncbi:AAA family ATPase [Paenibacillus larvae]|uniref:ATPase n=16 Tax=root TaxID=1 RepID=A0A0C5AC21_9CAUD|nr:AAA family ATPase [Paenibacillus larvae]YP_008320383.1 AAA family ATPase [Paenibacillus phage phiIBB_P123]YP_009203247.1 AAA family ATPase [Paenibacillus phage Fern]YP_009203496.1 AAA family ATPase [Paenibacillus phage Sitara]YP_009593454.1 AAA family ATPase [Paenibacillus phage Willow]YP_009836311.1 AAA family ATPase [Paenibacillus phage BN12]YP_009836525.1 AAA family ATPase [Paenibacillus phage Tadhana]YP_009836662.1 AAA family ATPase [Paenibacillus phage Likha]YP_009838679.1 AAA famil